MNKKSVSVLETETVNGDSGAEGDAAKDQNGSDNSSALNGRRRVKLYTLNEQRVWQDQGTGHVSPVVDKQSGLSLIVRSETDCKCPESLSLYLWMVFVKK